MTNEEDPGYNIHDENDRHVFEITDPTAFQAYTNGVRDEKQWSRHPVTNKLKEFATTHRKHAQVFVKYGDSYNKIR